MSLMMHALLAMGQQEQQSRTRQVPAAAFAGTTTGSCGITATSILNVSSFGMMSPSFDDLAYH